MNIPTRAQAVEMIREGQSLNPGPWVQHSWFVGKAAEAIARCIPALDAEAAFVLGYLHDIGRQEGVTDMRHALDGYTFLAAHGFDDAARICVSHSFPIKQMEAVAGQWDCTEEELIFLRHYLAGHKFDDYDQLIQLCDAIALPSGFCLVEKRLMDVALRRGVNEFSVPRWKAYFAIQSKFETAVGKSIYRLLDGVVENTFGFDLSIESEALRIRAPGDDVGVV